MEGRREQSTAETLHSANNQQPGCRVVFSSDTDKWTPNKQATRGEQTVNNQHVQRSVDLLILLTFATTQSTWGNTRCQHGHWHFNRRGQVPLQSPAMMGHYHPPSSIFNSHRSAIQYFTLLPVIARVCP